MSDLCDVCLFAPTKETPLIQQIHITAAHIVCNLVECSMFGRPGRFATSPSRLRITQYPLSSRRQLLTVTMHHVGVLLGVEYCASTPFNAMPPATPNRKRRASPG